MAREALSDDRDVVVPQFLARSEFVERLEKLAAEATVPFVEVVLAQELDDAMERLRQREAAPMNDSRRDAHRLLDRSGGIDSVPDLHASLWALVAARPRTMSVETVDGDVESTYRKLVRLLPDTDGGRRASDGLGPGATGS